MDTGRLILDSKQKKFSLFVLSCVGFLLCGGAQAQLGSNDGEWTNYASDTGSTKYTSLDQINADNFEELEIVWRWTSIDGEIDLEAVMGDAAEDISFGRLQATPLMIDGVLYMITALNQAVALDSATGELLWSFDPQAYLSGYSISPLGYHHRGVAYWSDNKESRILFATNDGYLFSLDAEEGRPDTAFAGGRIDLTQGIPRADRESLDYSGAVPLGTVSPAIVVGDVLVVNQITSNRPHYKERPPTFVRGYNIRSGELVWTFNTIPQAGEFGVETWQEESWRYTGNGGVWTQMSADLDLGLVYLPTEAPTNDYYGGHRPGDNLFTQSVVAVDAATGDRVWHFQMIHHGLWDYDTPAAPNLMNINVDGREIRALAQVTKQGWAYVFDRATGVPVWPMPELPVPQGLIPGERTSPTQPFPTKPPAFAMQGLTEDELIDFTPELKAEALEIIDDYVYGPIYTPASLPDEETAKRGSIFVPSAGGGANWPGAGFDPETNVLFIPSSNGAFTPFMGTLPEDESNFRYYRLQNRGVVGPRGLPLLKPPYSTITAIDMNTGDHKWMAPLGNGDRFRNHPMLRSLDLPPLGGDSGRNGPLLTKTILVQTLTAGGENGGPQLVAYDKDSGSVVGAIDLPGGAIGSPMTYMLDGRQYIAVTVGGVVPGLVALRLPL